MLKSKSWQSAKEIFKKAKSSRLFLLITFTCLIVLALIFSEFKKIEAEPVSSCLLDQRADCAVVLTDGRPRIRERFDLLARQEVKKLIISGVHPGVTLRGIIPQWPF